MSEFLAEGCVLHDPPQNISEECENTSPGYDMKDEGDGTVFTLWDANEKENTAYNHHFGYDICDNRSLQYNDYSSNTQDIRDEDMDEVKFRTLPASSDLTAALETEKEFLNFMSSLPQQQKDNKEVITSSNDVESDKFIVKHDTIQAQSPSKQSPIVINASHLGLDHLDNLCKMIEQLNELREQNNRLQKRVHYLEDIKALGYIQNDPADDTFSQLLIRNLNLSASDLRLEEIPESPVFGRDSDESLNSFTCSKNIEVKDLELLDLPLDTVHMRSSSDDDSRRTESTETPSSISKEKKIPKTTWGKVKHIMNYSKKDNIRKKLQPVDPPIRKPGRMPHSLSTTSEKASSNNYREPRAISDLEEYGLYCDQYDGDGSSWELECEGENGIWINPKNTDFSPEYFFSNENVCRNRKKKKPHLTITVPSCEDVSLHTINTLELLSHRDGVGKISPESTGSLKDRKPSSNYSATPPSPRRTSHWSKVKQAFLTSHNQTSLGGRHSQKQKLISYYASPPNSPYKRVEPTSFNFEGSILKAAKTDDGFSSELSPGFSMEKSRMEDNSPTTVHGLQKNLMDLQKTLTGEFTKKLNEWEKLRKTTSQDTSSVNRLPAEFPLGIPQPDSIPFEFRKKMNDWDKTKLKEKPGLSMPMNVLHFNQSHQQSSLLQKNLKTKNYEEKTLPPEFKKKLTEWQIRKALVGKCEHNVEEIQKNLGEDFNKKIIEWDRMKAQAKVTVESDIGGVPLNGCMSPHSPHSPHNEALSGRVKNRSGFPVGAKLTSLAGAAAVGAGSVFQSSLDRKGSNQKIKKNKIKEDKCSSIKGEHISKNRKKELQWLEKELSKIDREKQRLEREKEKFMERGARLEKMKYAMKERKPQTKEIYIKTSTGEFRFEGISQTFTKKLYEWEERRGIRPESSTFVLLDPNYKAPDEMAPQDKPKTPEPKKIVKSRSESSLVERAVASIHSNPSTLSLPDEKDDGHSFQIESKAASEPTLPYDDSKIDRHSIAVILPKENVVSSVAEEQIPQANYCSNEGNDAKRETSLPFSPTFASDEIIRLIDSSEGEEHYCHQDEKTSWNYGNKDAYYLHRNESVKSEGDYTNLLHENMTLLGQLKEKENVCRAIETQMGDLDNKMDNVADQHIRTLERLHRHVNIMRKSESFGNPSEHFLEETESEKNRVLITQLKSRIAELEEKGDKFMEDKEELECVFTLHKEQETQIAESLLLRIRELQDAGAEVNIQTVQCQTDDLELNESHETSDENKGSFENHDLGAPVKKKRRRKREDAKNDQRCLIDDESEEDDIPPRRSTKDLKEGRRKRWFPPRNVQKLHNLTADLLFQAKRLEQGIIAKHNLNGSGNKARRNDSLEKHIRRNRSLKTQRSLRIPLKESEGISFTRRGKLGPDTAKTWSSIEAIGTEKVSDQWENKASAILFESQDLLKMNSDLTRMARELRKEMTNIWSFKDSTSESNSSDNITGHLESRIDKSLIKLEKEDDKLEEEETWLAKQATEVFKSIASLQSEKTICPSRELSLDEEASKMKEKSICPTHDQFKIPEAENDEFFFNFTNNTSKRNSALNENPYIEREGTFLDDNFCFRQESPDQKYMENQQDNCYRNLNDLSINCDSLLEAGKDTSHSYSTDGTCIQKEANYQKCLKQNKNDFRVEPNLSHVFCSTKDRHLGPDQICESSGDAKKIFDLNSAVLNTNTSTCGLPDVNESEYNSRKYRFHKILPYETEDSQLQNNNRSPGKDLRRRVSDSQIDYSNFQKVKETEEFKQVHQNLTLQQKIVTGELSVRRNKSVNDVLLLNSINNNIDDSNIFVPTNRTLFTVIDKEGCISHIKKSIIESEDIHAPKIFVVESINVLDNLNSESIKNTSSLDSKFNVLNISKMGERVPKSHDPPLYKKQQESLLDNVEVKSDTRFPLLLKNQLDENYRSPLGYRSFPRRTGNSVETCKSKGFKTVIDIFSNRITRNQQLLMNPFAMGDPFIEVKKRQTLSSDYIDVLNSEEQVTSMYLDLNINRDNILANPVSNFSIGENKSFSLQKIRKKYNQNFKFALDELNELSEEQVKYKKSQLQKAKDDFFQEIVVSVEDIISAEDTTGKYSSEKKLTSIQKHTNEKRSVACQKDQIPLDNESSSSCDIRCPQKSHRSSIIDVGLRMDSSTQQKTDRNSFLSNLTSNKVSKGIMKLLRREKSPDEKSHSTIETLCQHSLTVNGNKKISIATDNITSPDISLTSGTKLFSDTSNKEQISMSLPRGACALTMSCSGHSCPATPIVREKSKPSRWFQRSCKILKGKSISPGKKKRELY